MNRTLIALAAIRAVLDAADTITQLAGRFGVDQLGAHGHLGEWDLNAAVSPRRFGIGLVGEHDPARCATWPETSVVALHLGPLTLSATREREWAPGGAAVPAIAAGDCGLAEDYSPGERIMLGLDDPGPAPSADELRLMDEHVAEQPVEQPVEQPEYRPYRSVDVTCQGCGARLITQPDPRGIVVDVGGCKEPTFYDGPPFRDENGRVHA